MASDPRAPRWLAAALLAGVALALPPPARAQQPAAPAAQPGPADRETARSLMDEGDDRMEAKDHAAALKAYEGADAIMHLPMTGIAVAEAQAALGRLVEARDKAMAVKLSPVGPGENAAYARARERAAALADSLASRIPSIKITVEGGPAEVDIWVDDVALPRAAAAAPRRVNPGKHVVVAKAPGYEGRVEVSVREGATLPVTVTLKPAAGGAPARGDKVTPPPGPRVDAPTERGTSPLVLLSFGVGAAGVIVGTVTGILSISRTSDLEGACQDKLCPPGDDDYNGANTLANISNVAFALGAVGVGAGVVGLVVSGADGPAPKSKGVSVRPAVGPGAVMITGVF